MGVVSGSSAAEPMEFSTTAATFGLPKQFAAEMRRISHSGSPRRKTKTSVLSFPRNFGPHPNFFGTIRRYGRYPYWHCRRSMVMSQLSSPTPRRKSRYRGYDIKMERRDLCWMVTMKPSRPGLPKFPQPSFQTATQSTREALSQAKRRVDHALARSMLSATSRSGRKINAALR